MSLLDDTNLVTIKLYYTYKDSDSGNKLVVIKDEDIEGLLKDEEKSKSVEILDTQWKPLTWKEQNDVMQMASRDIDLTTGEKQFNFVVYRDAMVKKCFKKWNIKNNGMDIPITPENIDRLPSDIVLLLYQKFEKFIEYSGEELKK